MSAAVTRNEQHGRLGPCVHQTRLCLADRKRLDDSAAKAGWPPGCAAVVGAEHALALRAGVDHAGVEWIDGQAAHVLLAEQCLNMPCAAGGMRRTAQAAASGGDEAGNSHDVSPCTNSERSTCPAIRSTTLIALVLRG